MKELVYVVGQKGNQIALMSTKHPSKCLLIDINELYRFTSEISIGGVIGSNVYPCLYSREQNQWYPDYYRKAHNVLFWRHRDGTYTEMHARLVLPMCSIFAHDSTIIVVSDNNANVNNLHCMQNGFTGMTFDSVVWNHTLFVHVQTVKLYGEGLYFIYNYVGILKSNLELYQIYRTRMSIIRRIESAYGLDYKSAFPDFTETDAALVNEKLHLFVLGTKSDGVYLDALRIFGG